jgi:hypothetical protein
MELNTIPRTAVRLTLDGLRLPVIAAENIAGQRDNDSWPPAVLFESFEATVKQVVGSVIRDETLVDEGRIQQAKVGELRKAVELEVEADQKRAVADGELQARRQTAEQQRRKVEEDTRRREQAIEREKRAAEQKAEREAAERRAAVDRAADVRDKRVSATERQARLTRVEAESTALTAQRRAVKASKTAAALGDAVEQKKTERKRS